MTSPLDVVLIFLILTTLTLLGSNRLPFGIRLVAAQGMALGVLLPMAGNAALGWRVLLLAACVIAVKGVVIPQLLFRARRDAQVRVEPQPPVGYATSIVGGVVILGLASWLAGPERLPLPHPASSPLEFPVALFTILAGLFLIVGRRNALNQVLGYLVLENGVFLAGIALAREEPLLVGMGVLLDVFGAVLVMGIAIFHISRTFDSIDVDQLTILKD